MFPDTLERNLSNDHRRRIVYSFRDKLPANLRPKIAKPALLDCDRAIWAIRQQFEADLGTTEIDFYRPPIYQQWWTGFRDEARTQIGSELGVVLRNYNLELRQCGSKKKTLANCYAVDETTGFWAKPTDATNKPLRWILHLQPDPGGVKASVPSQHGSRRVAFANTAQGTGGAITVRIVPAIRLGQDKWEIRKLCCADAGYWLITLSIPPYHR